MAAAIISRDELKAKERKAERRRQLRRRVELNPVVRDFEFSADSPHSEITIVVLNSRSEEEAAQKVDAFLEHVRRRGFQTFATPEKKGGAA